MLRACSVGEPYSDLPGSILTIPSGMSVLPEVTARADGLTPWPVCQFDCCELSEYAQGWCRMHWGRVRDGRALEDMPRRSDGMCAHYGCDEPTSTRKKPYCRRHDYRDQHGNRMDDIPQAKPRAKRVPDDCAECLSKPWARGMCPRHYIGAWKAGKLTDKDGNQLGPPPPAECANCHEIKRIKARGLCSRCHMAATRAGTLDQVALASRRRVSDCKA